MKKTIEFKNIPKIFENDRNIKIAVIIGFSVITLILLFDFFAPSESAKPGNEDSPDADSYISGLENRLVKIVSEIEGAGKVSVMLTLESMEENIFSEKETAVRTIKPPIVRGVAVICDGGGSAVVKAKIVETVSKVLGISSSRVCVTN